MRADISEAKTADGHFIQLILTTLDKLSAGGKKKIQFDILTIVKQKLEMGSIK